MPDPRTIFIGGGNMARALILGAVERAGLAPDTFAVVEPYAAQREPFEKLGVPTSTGLLDGLARFDGALQSGSRAVVVLAVKPQSLASVAQQWTAAGLTFDGVVITMLAGATSSAVRSALGGLVRVVRVMPNTPARVGQGATAVALGSGARPGDEAAALELFRAVGPVVEMVDEAMMDAVTALSGSGPAYLFLLAEAMTRAGVEAGLPGPVADRLTRQTLAGASALLAASPDSASDLRAAVTSKGGTTEAALKVLSAQRVPDAVVKAVLAARDRGRELGTPAGGDR